MGYHCYYAYYLKWVLSACMSYNEDSKFTLQSCFSLGYNLLYIDRLLLRTPAVAVAVAVAVADIDVGRERDHAGCNSA